MIHNVVDFRAVTARDVMMPIAQVQMIRSDAPIDELLAISRERGLDRLPVISSRGEIIGLVNVFEVLLDRTSRGEVGSYQRRIVTAVADEQAYQVIRKMRAARVSLAAVVDSGGNPIGIVSSED